MKKCLAALLALLLAGCGNPRDLGMELRQRLLSGPCSFRAEITADYGDTLSVFTLDCQGDADGNLRFAVAAPESIAGVEGTIAAGKGALTFDEAVLSFPLLADGQLSPVSAPWLLLRILRGGSLQAQGQEGDLTRLTFRDGYREEDLLGDVWLDETGTPLRAEFLHRERKILSINVSSFRTESAPGA